MPRIAHTTDFSPASHKAFLSALTIAVATRADFDIVHVGAPATAAHWDSFPRVRETLSGWGLLMAAAKPADVEPQTGVRVTKIEVQRADAVAGLSRYFAKHKPDLLVAAAHGRQGLDRLTSGSRSEQLMEKTRLPALLVGPNSTGLSGSSTGRLAVADVLLPLSDNPPPEKAIDAMFDVLIAAGLGDARVQTVTIGLEMADLLDRHGRRWPVTRFEGPVVDTILSLRERSGAGIIAMPTAGAHGMAEALRGSTTSQIVALAPVPVLALPMM